jgi:hypothetical protein
MTEDCVRSITFEIPGKNANHGGVQVYAEEHDGTIVFTIQSLGGDDIRGFFFHLADESLLGGLQFSSLDPSIVETRVGNDNVIDMGNGANMRGAVRDGFDVGLEFGTPGAGHDVITGPVSFTLGHATQDLTLDDIAHVLFGARMTSSGAKITEVSPAAPDAIDDDFNIFEDGQSGFTDPSHVPEAVLFDVLANDTDADGDTLEITDAYGALHGTVQIVDDPLGDYILYTPDADFSGIDSFTYCIDDNDGGTDFAVVDIVIQAVADIPDIDIDIIASDQVNVFTMRVTATQTDLDASEFIDQIFLGGIVPAGVSIVAQDVENPVGTPDTLVVDYLITLPLGTDTSFTIDVNALAQEESNGDTQIATEQVLIEFEHNLTTTPVEFSAVDQSIWDTGTEFSFDDQRFIGLDTGPFDERIPESGGVVFAGINGHIRVGFESTLHFEGGDINATADYDITVETNYNLTTDQLLIDTSALLTDADFTTDFAEGTYTLDFVWDVLLNAFAGINIDFGEIDFDPLDVIPGDQVLDLGGIQETLNIPTVDFDGSANLLDLDSDTLAGEFAFPDPLSAFSVDFDWPDVTAVGSFPPNPVVGGDASDYVLQLNLDVDELLATILGLPVNPLNPELDIGIFFAELDLLNVVVNGGMNLIQDFAMTMGDLTGILAFEDGSTQLFTIGDSVQLDDASQIDDNGLGIIGTADDGNVDFAFTVVPTSTLQNATALGFNIGYDIELLSVTLGYDITIPNPFGDDQHLTDSFTLGPLATFTGSTPLGEVEIFNETFGLNFQGQQVAFLA